MAEGNSQSMAETVEKARGVLPKMAYTGRLRPKGVPFPGFRYMKGERVYTLKYTKGWENLPFGSMKWSKGLTEAM